ncbi:hypothetical protein [Flavobacterium pedocola]
MQANTIMNKSLFRNFGGSTQNINASIMVAHPVYSGTYNGTVYQHGKLLGQFELLSSEQQTETQVDIDLSVFTKSLKLQDDCDCKSMERKYSVKDKGYVFFFVSGSEDGFHIELEPFDKKNAQGGRRYSTKQLQKGDIVVSLIMRPGIYEITGSEKEKCSLTVEVPKDLENYKHYLSQSTSVILSERGFDKKEIKTAPGEGIVVILEKDSNIEVALLKPTEVKDNGPGPKAHRWQKRPPYKK